MEAASSSGRGLKEASAQTAPFQIVMIELAAEAAQPDDAKSDEVTSESGEEVDNPHKRKIFECEGRAGRVKACILGKKTNQPFYLVCWGEHQEIVDDATLQSVGLAVPTPTAPAAKNKSGSSGRGAAASSTAPDMPASTRMCEQVRAPDMAPAGSAADVQMPPQAVWRKRGSLAAASAVTSPPKLARREDDRAGAAGAAGGEARERQCWCYQCSRNDRDTPSGPALWLPPRPPSPDAEDRNWALLMDFLTPPYMPPRPPPPGPRHDLSRTIERSTSTRWKRSAKNARCGPVALRLQGHQPGAVPAAAAADGTPRRKLRKDAAEAAARRRPWHMPRGEPNREQRILKFQNPQTLGVSNLFRGQWPG